jgi:multidrug efflux pump subunit AcrB
MLVVEKFPSANTREVTEGVEDALEDLSPGLSGVNTDARSSAGQLHRRRAGQPRHRRAHRAGLLVLPRSSSCASGARSSVALITIPLSLIAAALTLDALGETFNAITLTGLAIAVAIIVGDAVTGAERVARRMHARREAGDEAPTASIVTEATSEIRSPLVYGTLIALLAIVPLAGDGRPPGRVLRADGAGLRAGGRGRHVIGGHADPGAAVPPVCQGPAWAGRKTRSRVAWAAAISAPCPECCAGQVPR